MYSTDMENMMVGVVMVVLVIYLLLLAIMVANYIMNALALHKLGNRRLIPNAWMAWIPVANSYLLGNIADEYDGRNGIKRKWRVLLLALDSIFVGVYIVGYIALMINVFTTAIMSAEMNVEDVAGLVGLLVVIYGWLLVIVILASVKTTCRTICVYKIFESTVPKKSVTFLILSLLVPLAESICLFSCRNKGYSNEIAVESEVIPEASAQIADVSEEVVSEEIVQPSEVAEATEEAVQDETIFEEE